MQYNIIYEHMREIILTQRADRDRMLAANYVPREGLDRLRAALPTNLIKVITGPRRAGKSVFAIQALKGKDFAYLNFDDERLVSVTDYDEILKGIRQVYGGTKFLLFDEIQNMPKWELFLSRLTRSGFNIVATGSNSRLLSSELSTHLTGRHIPFEILPFSFGEFLTTKDMPDDFFETKEKQGEVLSYLDEYLQKGGYPEVVVNGVEHKSYLKTLFESVLLKDIVGRYRVRNSQGLKNIGFYLLTNHSASAPRDRSTSYNELATALKFNSVNTLEKYISYLEEVFIVFKTTRFSFKVREQIKSPKKFYGYDLGMVDAVKFKISNDTGRLLENAVAIELKRRGEEFYYYKTPGNKEVDFVVKNGTEVVKLIQVCYNLSDPKTEKREFSALVKAAQELRCSSLSIVTWDHEKTVLNDGFEIHLIPASKWLLGIEPSPKPLT